MDKKMNLMMKVKNKQKNQLVKMKKTNLLYDVVLEVQVELYDLIGILWLQKSIRVNLIQKHAIQQMKRLK